MSKATAHYEDTDLAMFAMQLLDSEDHQATAEHVSACAFCRQELARLQGDLAACAYGVEMQAPAAPIRERVMHRVAREKRAVPVVEEVSCIPRMDAVLPTVEAVEEPTMEFRRRGLDARPARRPRRETDPDEPGEKWGSAVKDLFLWLGWTVAIALAVAAGRFYLQQAEYRTRLAVQAGELTRLKGDAEGARRLLDVMTAPSARQIPLSPPESDATSLAEGHVIYEADKGSLVLLADHLAPLGPEKVYELWLIPADGRNPIPAGTFHPDARGDGSVILPSLPRGVQVQAFGITVEDGTGSGTPTMPIVLAGS
jgi:anti-sigma-K factor RskA